MKMKLLLLSLALVAISFGSIQADKAARYYPLIVNGTDQSVKVEASKGNVILDAWHSYTLNPGDTLHNLGNDGPQRFKVKVHDFDERIEDPFVIVPGGKVYKLNFQQIK